MSHQCLVHIGRYTCAPPMFFLETSLSVCLSLSACLSVWPLPLTRSFMKPTRENWAEQNWNYIGTSNCAAFASWFNLGIRASCSGPQVPPPPASTVESPPHTLSNQPLNGICVKITTGWAPGSYCYGNVWIQPVFASPQRYFHTNGCRVACGALDLNNAHSLMQSKWSASFVANWR